MEMALKGVRSRGMICRVYHNTYTPWWLGKDSFSLPKAVCNLKILRSDKGEVELSTKYSTFVGHFLDRPHYPIH